MIWHQRGHHTRQRCRKNPKILRGVNASGAAAQSEVLPQTRAGRLVGLYPNGANPSYLCDECTNSVVRFHISDGELEGAGRGGNDHSVLQTAGRGHAMWFSKMVRRCCGGRRSRRTSTTTTGTSSRQCAGVHARQKSEQSHRQDPQPGGTTNDCIRRRRRLYGFLVERDALGDNLVPDATSRTWCRAGSTVSLGTTAGAPGSEIMRQRPDLKDRCWFPTSFAITQLRWR